jgi:hypothetical protein
LNKNFKMSALKVYLIIGMLCLLAVNLNAVPVKSRIRNNSKTSPANSSDPDYSAVCISSDRGKNNCSNTLTKGCLCYNNGTCVYTDVNKCKDCSNEDVFSVLPGQQCETSQPYLCQPPVPGVKYTCVQASYEGCVCTLNGTCSESNISHCIDCQDPNNLAVFENKSCPASYLQTPPSKYFIPNPCNHTDQKSISCLKTQTPGCVCYSSNNTCEYRTDSNKCLLCFNKDVASFNQGEYCPSLNGKIYVCDGSDSTKNCTASDTSSSCVCTGDGKCNATKTNHCKACASSKVVDVVEGSSCPLAKYVVTTAKKL